MGEAAQVEIYHDYDVNGSKQWHELIEVVPVPLTPPAPQPVPKNVSKRSRKFIEISQPVSQTGNLPKCLWCGKPFHGRANKRFCTPGTERKLNFKRRQALTLAVAEHFKQRGCSVRTGTLQNVAKKCIDADYEWWLGAMQKLGWKYNASSCQWVLKV